MICKDVNRSLVRFESTCSLPKSDDAYWMAVKYDRLTGSVSVLDSDEMPSFLQFLSAVKAQSCEFEFIVLSTVTEIASCRVSDACV